MPVYRWRDKWRYDFIKKGVRHQESGYKTKQEARAAEATARKNLKGTNSDFIGLCASRLRELKSRRTEKWLYENQMFIEKLTPIWGKKKEITSEDVAQLLEPMAETPVQANSRLKMLKALFRHGIDRGIWREDPTIKISKFPVENKRKYIPSTEDIKAVLETAKPMDRLYLLVLAHSMGRVNAINQLKWEHIHDKYISLFTRKARNSNLKEIIIPMNSVLRSSLEAIPKQGEYVFINPRTMKPYVYRTKFLKTLCKNAKVTPFTFHCIRHFTASLLDNKGVPLNTIRQLLGHERSTTTDIYLQELRGTTDEAIKLLEELS